MRGAWVSSMRSIVLSAAETRIVDRANVFPAAPRPSFVLVALVTLAGCIDLTPPWQNAKVIPGTGDAGPVLDGSPATSVDVSSDSPAGGALGTADAASFVGSVDTGLLVGQGGNPGHGGAGIDAIASGTGGARVDGAIALDAASAMDSAIMAGGNHADAMSAAGATGDARSPSAGGAAGNSSAGSGGTTSTGGTTHPDAAADVGPDVSPGVEAGALLTGLVAYYPCEGVGTDGVTLEDSSGNGNHGTLSTLVRPDGGTALSGKPHTFPAGAVGNALLLASSASGYVKLPTRVFADATDMTVALWIKVSTTVDWQKAFDVGVNANLGIPSTTGMVYMYFAPKLAGGTAPTFSIASNGTGGDQRLDSKPSLGPNNGWTHVAVVMGTTVTMYINGAQVASNGSVKLRPKDLGAIDYAWIGRSQFTSTPTFDGAIDEFRVYRRALGADEIKALYTFRAP